MTRLQVLVVVALSGCARRTPVPVPGILAPPTPTPRTDTTTFDLVGAENTLLAAESDPDRVGVLLITGMTESGAIPPGCARNWLDTLGMEAANRLLVLNTALEDGLCDMPCGPARGAVSGSAGGIQVQCVPDRFGTTPPAHLSAAEYLYAVLTVDRVHAALDADRSPRAAELRQRFDALLPRVPATLQLPEHRPAPEGVAAPRAPVPAAPAAAPAAPADATAPAVASAEVSVGEGATRSAAVDEVVRVHQSELLSCYERQLTEHPELAGDVVLEFGIAADGTVMDVSVVSSTLGSPVVAECVVARFSVWQFPATGEAVVVRHAVTFSPG